MQNTLIHLPAYLLSTYSIVKRIDKEVLLATPKQITVE